MKKFLIQFTSADMPSIEDDGIGCGVNGGILMEEGSKNKIKFFDSKEEADKYLEEVMIPEDKAELEECYGFNDETCDPYVYIDVEEGTWGRKELVVTDKFDATELNTTLYEVIEVEL